MRTHITKPTHSYSSAKTKTIQKKDDRQKRSQKGHETSSHRPVMTEWGSITNNVLRTLESAESSPNQTGLPDNLKAGVEHLSGYSLDDVRVHYNSPKPAQLQALAYTQGTEIHVAPGQEQHLPHEVWHVVQQMQGRVKPTMQMKGVQINNDEGLENEADVMGEKGLRQGKTLKRHNSQLLLNIPQLRRQSSQNAVQMLMSWQEESLLWYWLGTTAETDLTRRRPGRIDNAALSQAIRLRWFNVEIGPCLYTVGINIHYGGHSGGLWIINEHTRDVLEAHPHRRPRHRLNQFIEIILPVEVQNWDQQNQTNYYPLIQRRRARTV